MLKRIMLLMLVRSMMIDRPLYMLDLATATDASPISLDLPSSTLCARVFRVSSGYVYIREKKVSFNSLSTQVRITYTKPRSSAANGAGDHGRPERPLGLAQLLCSDLLRDFVHPKVHPGAQRVTHGMEMEAGVQPSDPVPPHDLLDGLERAQTRLGPERCVPRRIGGGLGTVRHQDRGLDHVLGQFERAYAFGLVSNRGQRDGGAYKQEEQLPCPQPDRHR